MFKRTSETTKEKTNQEKVEIIRSLRDQYPLTELLKVLHLSKSSYFYTIHTSKTKYKELENQLIVIRQSHPNYGYRRMTAMLRKEGIINEKRVLRVMRKLQLLVTNYHHKSRKYNSYKGTVGKIAQNIVKRRFETFVLQQKMVTDTTEFKYYEEGEVKKVYLNPFLDLFNREVISYSLTKKNARAIIDALEKAISKSSDYLYRRTIYSDQGWAYQMHQYTDTLKKHHIFQSMSRKGKCYDNSVMENFFGLLKQEIYYGNTFTTYEKLKTNINDWIIYYNQKRIKKKLDWLYPEEYRLKMIQ
ncbi:IS3 family transposase [Enterococcus faecium]|nr:IS3 family transposase [Enterococcus faecium]